MDGARVFNAATALGVSVARITRDCDSVMFCISKGLGAPVGSLLVSSAEHIAQARLYRKRLGGGMRQAGILAAAGLLAIEESPRRLVEDHANAKLLAERLDGIPGIRLDTNRVVTNIVIFDVSELGVSARQFSQELKTRGVLSNGVGPNTMRMVTHCDVNEHDCTQAVEAAAEIAHMCACKNSKDALHPVL
jgi:threonine aldolase